MKAQVDVVVARRVVHRLKDYGNQMRAKSFNVTAACIDQDAVDIEAAVLEAEEKARKADSGVIAMAVTECDGLEDS
jgi:hypothetical protein